MLLVLLVLFLLMDPMRLPQLLPLLLLLLPPPRQAFLKALNILSAVAGCQRARSRVPRVLGARNAENARRVVSRVRASRGPSSAARGAM